MKTLVVYYSLEGNTEYQPKKITAVAFALTLKLSLDETKDLLGRAGYCKCLAHHFHFPL